MKTIISLYFIFTSSILLAGTEGSHCFSKAKVKSIGKCKKEAVIYELYNHETTFCMKLTTSKSSKKIDKPLKSELGKSGYFIKYEELEFFKYYEGRGGELFIYENNELISCTE